MDSASSAWTDTPSVGPGAPDMTSKDVTSDGAASEDEYVLVGGGLQNALIALALLESRPNVRLSLIEREARVGGNHTWCFHASDVPDTASPWLERLVVRR